MLNVNSRFWMGDVVINHILHSSEMNWLLKTDRLLHGKSLYQAIADEVDSFIDPNGFYEVCLESKKIQEHVLDLKIKWTERFQEFWVTTTPFEGVKKSYTYCYVPKLGCWAYIHEDCGEIESGGFVINGEWKITHTASILRQSMRLKQEQAVRANECGGISELD